MYLNKLLACILAATFATSANAAIKIVLPVSGGFAQSNGANSTPETPETPKKPQKPDSDCALFNYSDGAQLAGQMTTSSITRYLGFDARISNAMTRGVNNSCNYSVHFEYKNAAGSVICTTPSANISEGYMSIGGDEFWAYPIYASGFEVEPGDGKLTAGSCAELSRKVCDGVAPGGMPNDYNFTNVVQVFNYSEGDFTHTFSIKYDRDMYFNEPC